MKENTRTMLRRRVLEYSIRNELSHIPSALSMFNYLHALFNIDDSDELIDPYTWNVVIGKPFGAQAYYILWHYYYMLDISSLSYGVKHSEIGFVDYGEETLGNALGIASGIAYNGKPTWVNLSDGAMQMGATLEAIQFIGHNKQNILCTIDWNNTQLTGYCDEIMGLKKETIIDIFESCSWNVVFFDHIKSTKDYLKQYMDEFRTSEKPTLFLFETIKGDGIVEMENDPVQYHYKQLGSIDEITFR